MASKTADRLRVLQERAAALASVPTQTNTAEPISTALEATGSHFGTLLDHRQQVVQRIPVGHIAPDLRVGHRQARLLPLPDDLLNESYAASIDQGLIEELRDLAKSLKERQIQPILIYPGTSEQYPAARFLILVGHRRWTAACLGGLDSLDAIIIEEPDAAERVLLQYTENEAREEFSDMERAWSLLQLKQAMQDAPWEQVEERMQLSRARRQQLLRLTAFTSEQQQEIARLRLQETQARSLHSALRSGDLHVAQVDNILRRLTTIAVERTILAQQPNVDEEAPSIQSRRGGIDGPTVARLVARATQEGRATTLGQSALAAPRWLVYLREQLVNLRRDLPKAQVRSVQLEPSERAALRAEVIALQQQLDVLLETIKTDS